MVGKKVVFLRGFIAAAAAMMLVCSCKGEFDALLQSQDFNLKYKAAFDYFNAKKYSKASALFESMKMMVNGMLQEDTVNYYCALSHYRGGDVGAAEQAFFSFFSTFPRSPFASEARYLHLDCLFQQTYRYELDQVPTHKALAAIAEYMVDYPESVYAPRCVAMREELVERLERKEFEAAEIYYTTEDYKAAHYAFKTVLKENAETRYREEVMYYIALSSYQYALHSVYEKQRERYMQFTDDYYNFIGEYVESKYRHGLDVLFRKAQKFIKHEEGTESKVNEKALKKEIKQNQKMLKHDRDGNVEVQDNEI